MMSHFPRIRNFFTPPPELNREHQRFFGVMTVALSIALVAHIFYVVLFSWLGLNVLAVYNVLSVVTYAVSIWLIRRGYIEIPASLATGEMCIYVAISTRFLGLESGGIYLLFILALMFGILSVSFWVKLLWLVVIPIEVVFLYFRFENIVWTGNRIILDIFYLQNALLGLGVVVLVGLYLSSLVKSAELALDKALAQSDALLNNVMPSVIADRLKQSTEVIADSFPETSTLFADIVDFTPLSMTMSPAEVVNLLNDLFSRIDVIVEKHQLEKIKTIGDAYMVAAGVPVRRDDHAEAIVAFAFDLQKTLIEYNDETGYNLQFRIGINSGPVVAGVIGKLRFLYDLWGDSVNTASRMESHGIPNEIQVTEETRNLLKGKYKFEDRGIVEIKGKGPMRTYLLRMQEAI